ncbi:MAG: hypothetical protein AAGF26_19725 [Cyanobacteria bacterium P01_G01_bin.49]
MFNLSDNNRASWIQKIVFLGVISSLSTANPSVAATANFDSLPTGFAGSSITDNGITFSNLIAGFRLNPPQFIVQSGNQFDSVFSAPNYLTFGDSTVSNGNSGQVPPQPLLGAFGSMMITPEEPAESVSLDVLTTNPSFGPNSGLGLGLSDNSLVLQAFFEGESVSSTSIFLSEFSELNPSGQFLFANLSLSDIIFDELQLFTPIAFADGVIPLGVDNVNITNLNYSVPVAKTVPESQPLTVLGLFLMTSLGYLTKSKKPTTKS